MPGLQTYKGHTLQLSYMPGPLEQDKQRRNRKSNLIEVEATCGWGTLGETSQLVKQWSVRSISGILLQSNTVIKVYAEVTRRQDFKYSNCKGIISVWGDRYAMDFNLITTQCVHISKHYIRKCGQLFVKSNFQKELKKSVTKPINPTNRAQEHSTYLPEISKSNAFVNLLSYLSFPM